MSEHPECDQFVGRQRHNCLTNDLWRQNVAGLPPLPPQTLRTSKQSSGSIGRSLAERSADAASALADGTSAPRTAEPVGDRLHDVLEECGIPAKRDCGCTAWIRQMNAWGVAGCEQHRAEIRNRLSEAASEATLIQKAKVGLHGYFTLDSLIDEAIRRCRG